MIDLSKLADYPLWVKLLALAWLFLTILLAIIILFKKPQQKPQNQSPSQIPQAISESVKLPKEQEDILIFLSKQGESFTFQIAKLLTISEDIAKYHLEELRRNKFIKIGLPTLPGQHLWSIEHKAKKYLIENKLIS